MSSFRCPGSPTSPPSAFLTASMASRSSSMSRRTRAFAWTRIRCGRIALATSRSSRCPAQSSSATICPRPPAARWIARRLLENGPPRTLSAESRIARMPCIVPRRRPADTHKAAESRTVSAKSGIGSRVPASLRALSEIGTPIAPFVGWHWRGGHVRRHRLTPANSRPRRP